MLRTGTDRAASVPAPRSTVGGQAPGDEAAHPVGEAVLVRHQPGGGDQRAACGASAGDPCGDIGCGGERDVRRHRRETVPEDGAGTGDRIDGAGIVGKARIDADGHVLDRAGAAVDPRPCAVPVPGRLRRGGQAEALEIGIGEARHGAAAVPAAGREVGLPEGVVVAQNGAVPAPVPRPGPVIEGGDVAQPGTAMGEAGDLRPFAGRHGDAQIGIEDGSEPPRRAQLDRPGLAGQGVRPDLAAPPAPGAQDGLKFIPESLEGRAFGQRAIHGLTDIGEDVEAGDLGDGEGAGVLGGGVRCASHSRYACLWRGRTPPPPAAGRRGFRGRDQPSSGFPPSSPCCAPSVEIRGDAAARGSVSMALKVCGRSSAARRASWLSAASTVRCSGAPAAQRPASGTPQSIRQRLKSAQIAVARLTGTTSSRPRRDQASIAPTITCRPSAHITSAGVLSSSQTWLRRITACVIDPRVGALHDDQRRVACRTPPVRAW